MYSAAFCRSLLEILFPSLSLNFVNFDCGRGCNFFRLIYCSLSLRTSSLILGIECRLFPCSCASLRDFNRFQVHAEMNSCRWFAGTLVRVYAFREELPAFFFLPPVWKSETTSHPQNHTFWHSGASCLFSTLSASKGLPWVANSMPTGAAIPYDPHGDVGPLWGCPCCPCRNHWRWFSNESA